MLKTAWIIFYTEIILLLRRSQEWAYPIVFFLIVVSMFPLAFTPDPRFLQQYIPGCIWIAALLASLLSVQNVYANDIEDNHLEQLLLCETPLTMIIFIKCCAHWCVTELPLIFLTPILGVAFNLHSNEIMILCVSLLLGTPILSLIGNLSSALTLGLRQQSVLLGLIVLPLTIPILIFGVSIVQQVQNHFDVIAPVIFFAGLSILATMTLPFVIATTLRINIDN